MSRTAVTTKTKSYRFDRFGVENLVLKEEEQKPLEAGQVRVKLYAVSLNYRDLMMIKGLYNPKVLASGPIVPLSDGAGEIIEIAPDVKKFKIGDRVAGIFLQDWLSGPCLQEMTSSALGGETDGVLTTHKVFNQNGLVKLPQHLSYEEGSTLPCAAITAWHALIETGKLKAGQTVLVQGTGGVSIFALQFAKMSGAKVIVTSSSDEKLQQAKKLGADFLINYKTNPDWELEVRKITNGEGVDFVVEVGGANTLAKSFKAAKLEGMILVIGILSGIDSNLNLIPILMKNLCVQGIFVGSRAMFEAMNKAIAAHQLHPVIDKVFPFIEVIEAYKHLESGKHFGKIVIKIA